MEDNKVYHCDYTSDDSSTTRSIEHPPLFNCDRKQTVRKRSHHNATVISPGPPALYQLTTERKYIDGTDKKVRRWTYGKRDENKQNRVLLMVGETGAGKTTLINTMTNYILGVKFEDQQFYQITEEKDTDQAKSQTSEITVYEVFDEENPTSLTIIDTPGYAHTEGLEKDREIAEYLIRVFSDEDGIHHIDAVCFVMKAPHNRLSGKERYICHSVLSLFGRDIENNIVFLLTQSDGLPPADALNAIEKAEIPCRKNNKQQPLHFLFNNRQKDERAEDFEREYRRAWKMGEKSLNEFFSLLEENNRKSVQMTVDVLTERRRLEVCVSDLKIQTNEWEKKMQDLNQIQEALRQNRDDLQNCQNSKINVTKKVKEKVLITNVSWKDRNATCCTECQENCHVKGCWWVNDLSWCSVMENNHCTVCSGKCHYTKHIQENKRYEFTKKKIMMSFADLKQEYERTGEKCELQFDEKVYIDQKEKLERNVRETEENIKKRKSVISDLDQITKQQTKLLHEAYLSITILSKIALKADSAFTLQHLDFLIPKLKEEKGNEEWVKNLEELRKTGEEQKNKGALRSVFDPSG